MTPFSNILPLPIYRQRLLGSTHPVATSHPPSPPPAYAIPVPEPTFWAQWTRSSMAELLSSPHTLKPRQPEEVWTVFGRLKLPAKHKDFVHQALWSHLPFCQRQSAWKPLEVWCPLDCELETLQHTLFSCQFLVGAYDIIDTAFCSQYQHSTSVKSLLQDDTAASFTGGWPGPVLVCDPPQPPPPPPRVLKDSGAGSATNKCL